MTPYLIASGVGFVLGALALALLRAPVASRWQRVVAAWRVLVAKPNQP